MSWLEISLLVGTVGLVLAGWTPTAVRRPSVLGAAAMTVVSGTTAVVSGLRWQLTPVLVGATVGLLLALRGIRRPGRRDEPVDRPGRWWRRWRGPAAAAACLSLTATGPVAAWAFPVPVFPRPSGPYPVGTTVMEWTDQTRAEPATAEPDDRRTVVAQVWYPAENSPADVARAPYLGRTRQEAETVAGAVAGYLGLPSFLLDDATRARTHAVPGAAAAHDSRRHPVVVFSPGLGGVRTQNTAWAEDLASRGYVVAALDHPYDSAAVVLADGRTVHTRVTATGNDVEDERRSRGWMTVRAGDLSFALSQLRRLDRGELGGTFTGRLDTERAAVAGHSLGGAAALLAARLDPRFQAAINLDGFPYDLPYDPAPQHFRQPVLALTADLARFGADFGDRYSARLHQVLELSTRPSYRLTVPNAAHLTFTDAPLFLPPVPGLVGSLPGRADGPRLTAAATAVFLDATFAGRPSVGADGLARLGELKTYG